MLKITLIIGQKIEKVLDSRAKKKSQNIPKKPLKKTIIIGLKSQTSGR